MSLLDFFLRRPKQFVTRDSFEKNFFGQVANAPRTIEQLYGHGVTPDRQLKLEFFFYTNTIEKANSLTAALQEKQYDVSHWPSASDKKLRVISGWTGPILMHESAVLNWVRDMCRLGLDHDCEFDGWGTNPEQPAS